MTEPFGGDIESIVGAPPEDLVGGGGGMPGAAPTVIGSESDALPPDVSAVTVSW